MPNLITVSRLAATPLVVWMIVSESFLLAAIGVVVVGVTDFLDGFLARRFDLISRLGTLLDPVVDRVAIVAISIAFVYSGIVALALVAVVIVRDVVVALAFLHLRRRKVGEPEVSFIGKTATLLLLTSLPWLLLGQIWPSWVRIVGLTLFIAGAALYWAAAIGYAKKFFA